MLMGIKRSNFDSDQATNHMCKIKFLGADHLNFEEEDGGEGMGDFRKKYPDSEKNFLH